MLLVGEEGLFTLTQIPLLPPSFIHSFQDIFMNAAVVGEDGLFTLTQILLLSPSFTQSFQDIFMNGRGRDVYINPNSSTSPFHPEQASNRFSFLSSWKNWIPTDGITQGLTGKKIPRVKFYRQWRNYLPNRQRLRSTLTNGERTRVWWTYPCPLQLLSNIQALKNYVICSFADPDPLVFGPPGSIRTRHGSGSLILPS